MRARSAPLEPALGVERVRTVPGVEPFVVHGHDRRLPRRELGQHAQVEVAAVEVVDMQDVGRLRRQVEHAARGREAEVFAAAGDVEQDAGIAQCARATGAAVADLYDAVFPAPRVPHGEARIVPECPECSVQRQRDHLGAATDVGRVDLEDGRHRPRA